MILNVSRFKPFFLSRGINMNKKELQITTAMPVMKKSLLALAVAGTMAISGGAYAATDDMSVAAATAAAATKTSATVNTDTVNFVVITGTSAGDNNTTTTLYGNSTITIVTQDQKATAAVGAINTGLDATDTVTIKNGDIASGGSAVTLTTGAVTGQGILTVTGTTGSAVDTLTVSGSTVGSTSANLATVNVTGGVGHATQNAAVIYNLSSTLYTNDLNVTAGAGIDGYAGFGATSTITGNSTIGSGGIAVQAGAAVDTTNNASVAGVGGAATLTLTGTTTITSGAVTVTGGAGADNELSDGAGSATTVLGGAASLTFTGNVTSNSTLTITGGDAVTNLTTGGATVNIAGNATFSAITLDVIEAESTANLIINGTDNQLITGAISGSSAGEGSLSILNSTADKTVTFASTIGAGAENAIGTILIGGADTTTSTVVFNEAVIVAADGSTTDGIDDGAIVIGQTEGGSANVTFKKSVTAVKFDMGNASGSSTATNTLTFDATGADLTATGTIAGLDTEDLNTVVVTGGASGAVKTVTFATNMGNYIDTLAVGDNTTLVGNAVTAGAITLGSGATLLTAANSKTITGTIDGTAAGNGTLDVDHTVTAVVGSIGATASIAAIDIKAAKVLTTNSAVIKAGTITFGDATSELNTLSTATTITGNLVAASNGAGVLDVDVATTIVGNVGSSTSLDLDVTEIADVELTIDGNLYSEAVTLTGADSTLTFNGASAQTVSGTVDGGSAENGNIVVGDGTIESNVTFSSEIGDTAAIEKFTVSTGSTANISKDLLFNVVAGNDVIGLDVDGTLNVSSADNTVNIDAKIDGDIDIDGTVTVTGANDVVFTAVDASDTGAIAIDGTLTTLLTGTTKTLSLTADGSVNIGLASATTISAGNTIAISNTTSIGKNATTNILNIKKTADFDPDTMDVISADGVVTFVAGSALNVGLASDSLPIANGATIKVIDSAATVVAPGGTHTYTAMIASGRVALVDTAMIDIQHDTTGTVAEDLDIKVVHKTAVDGVTGQNNTALVNALASATAAANATEFNALASLTSTQTLDAAEKSQPDAGAATGAALAAVGGVNNVISGRQSATRVAFNALGNQSGVSTGDDANEAVVWAQIFGSSATQDKVGTIDGYDADSNGLALGWETDKSGDLMGLSVSYSDTDVDGKSASSSHTDTTAVQVAAYGTYGKATDWMVGYASGDNDTKRTALTGTASGKYDSNIFSAKVGHAFASSNTGAWTMTPKVDASYTNIDNDGYTETGAGNLNLIVASSSHDVLTARAGAEFTQHIVDGDSVTIPRVNIMAGYDLSNDAASVSSTFTGGGSAFTTSAAEPEKASLQLGFGVDHVSDDSTVSLDLNADLRSDYDSMSGSLTFKSKF